MSYLGLPILMNSESPAKELANVVVVLLASNGFWCQDTCQQPLSATCDCGFRQKNT